MQTITIARSKVTSDTGYRNMCSRACKTIDDNAEMQKHRLIPPRSVFIFITSFRFVIITSGGVCAPDVVDNRTVKMAAARGDKPLTRPSITLFRMLKTSPYLCSLLFKFRTEMKSSPGLIDRCSFLPAKYKQRGSGRLLFHSSFVKLRRG